MIVFVRSGPLRFRFSVALFEHGWVEVHKCASNTFSLSCFKKNPECAVVVTEEAATGFSELRQKDILEPLPVMKPTASWPVFALFSTSRSIGKKIDSQWASQQFAQHCWLCTRVCLCTVRCVFSCALIIQSRGLGLVGLTSSVRGACGLHLVSQ